MSRLDDLLGEGEARESEPPFWECEGTFVCQHCFEYCDEAKYFFTMKLLTWICSEGHKSFIQDFEVP